MGYKCCGKIRKNGNHWCARQSNVVHVRASRPKFRVRRLQALNRACAPLLGSLRNG
jgi:hypothetical protein